MAFTQQKAEYFYNKPWAAYGGSGDATSSLQPPVPEVNSILKPLDRDIATSEIEKHEVVFTPNGNLYEATGKSHAKGGTPVNLPEGSFIYSQHNPLALSKEDKELFQFKSGGIYKKKNSTPAAIVKKEVDIPHHNRMIAISQGDDHDDISKKSAELMLKKNFNKLGQVAFLQEEKKGFPQGLPSFSQGTAPILAQQQQEQVDTQKQYAMGGFTQLQRYQQGGGIWDTIKGYGQSIYDYFNPQSGYAGMQGNGAISSSPTDCTQHPGHPDCTPSRRSLIPSIRKPFTPGQLTDTPNDTPSFTPPSTLTGIIPGISTPSTPEQPASPQQDDSLPILPYNPRVPLTPAQKLSLGYNAYNAASVEKFYPKREQISFTPLNLERVSERPYLNQVDNSVSEAYRANSLYNPIIARAQNSQLYGQALQQRSQILGNIANQNSQIANQEAQYNNQGTNNTANQNAQLDQTYYNQVQALNQNFANEKRFATNQLVSNYNQYRSQDDDLQYRLASQQTPGTIDVWQDPKTGRISNTAQPGWTKRKQAAPIYDLNPRTGSVYYTGAGMSIDQLPNQTSGYSFQQLRDIVDQTGLTNDVARARLWASLISKNTPSTRR